MKKYRGYSNEFTKHMAETIHKFCETADKVAEYDKQVLLRCGLNVGDVISFSDFQTKVYENIIYAGKREEICGNCQWSSICHITNEPFFSELEYHECEIVKVEK